ncbi:MAG: beta-lactamase family protein [Gemmatimonadetes bacterium]|nr:beta-lactamase family protein [Gemmatimonadota bacterium]MYJ63649.1 beta-lactamase family protein [Acidimicrobiia bacterium]
MTLTNPLRRRGRGSHSWSQRPPATGNGDVSTGGIGDDSDKLSSGWRDVVADAAEGALERVLRRRLHAVGGQAAVFVDGELVAAVAAGVTGSGTPMQSDHLHHVFCLLKPLPFLALAAVVEQAGFGPDDPLEDIVDLSEWVPSGLTVRSLGSHADGLSDPSGWQWFMTRPADRSDLLAKMKLEGEPAYSDLVGPLVADEAIQRITGVNAAAHVTETLLKPLGLDDHIFFTGETSALGAGRLQCVVKGLPLRAIPMISTHLTSSVDPDLTSFAVGGPATMTGVAAFYAAVGEVLSGRPISGLPTPELLADLTAPKHLAYEPTTKRYALWAGGLIHSLPRVNISHIAGPASVGHIGGIASGNAVYDPTRRAAVALFLNGVSTNFDESAQTRLESMDRILGAIPDCEQRSRS